MKNKERIVAFIDVLGFKQRVISRWIDDPSSQAAITEFLKTVSYHCDTVGSRDSGFRIFAFSDSIAVVSTYQNVSRLIEFIRALLVKTAPLGFFWRGAIEMGLHEEIGNTFIGPAMGIAAHKETSTSIYPRIILSSKVIDALKKVDSDTEEVILRDVDGSYFIDMFCRPARWSNSDLHHKYLCRIKTVLSNQLEEAGLQEENVKQKIQWIISQFNNTVDKYEYDDNIKISFY